MYFKNRVDNQVKIKGHRIELDEISSCLIRYGIKKVNTIVYNKKIVAFYADKKKYNKNSVDVFLKKNIPEYMIPNYLFQIEKFPLTQNLKLNIKGLVQIAKKNKCRKVNPKNIKYQKNSHLKFDKFNAKKLIKFLNNTLKTSYKYNEKKNNLSKIALNSHYKWDSLSHVKLLNAIEKNLKSQ